MKINSRVHVTKDGTIKRNPPRRVLSYPEFVDKYFSNVWVSGYEFSGSADIEIEGILYDISSGDYESAAEYADMTGLIPSEFDFDKSHAASKDLLELPFSEYAKKYGIEDTKRKREAAKKYREILTKISWLIDGRVIVAVDTPEQLKRFIYTKYVKNQLPKR